MHTVVDRVTHSRSPGIEIRNPSPSTRLLLWRGAIRREHSFEHKLLETVESGFVFFWGMIAQSLLGRTNSFDAGS